MNFTVATLDQLRPILIGFRKSRGLTQAALAARLGIAQQTYAQLEANPATASVERLYRLLRVLGVELVLADVAVGQSAGAGVPDALPSRYADAASTSAPHSAQEPAAKPPATGRKREAW